MRIHYYSQSIHNHIQRMCEYCRGSLCYIGIEMIYLQISLSVGTLHPSCNILLSRLQPSQVFRADDSLSPGGPPPCQLINRITNSVHGSEVRTERFCWCKVNNTIFHSLIYVFCCLHTSPAINVCVRCHSEEHVQLQPGPGRARLRRDGPRAEAP